MSAPNEGEAEGKGKRPSAGRRQVDHANERDAALYHDLRAELRAEISCFREWRADMDAFVHKLSEKLDTALAEREAARQQIEGARKLGTLVAKVVLVLGGAVAWVASTWPQISAALRAWLDAGHK